LSKLNVIIAEDEPIIRLDIKELLEERGHKVVGEASNGREAVIISKKLKPDIVFMDIKMPIVILLTAYSDKEFIEKAKYAGVIGYLVKPVTESNLFPILEIGMTRYKKFVKIENKYYKTKEQLDNRKVIEKAKGILVEKDNIKEWEAYDKLRVMSMKQGKTLKYVSERK
jgi:response regulator NasT